LTSPIVAPRTGAWIETGADPAKWNIIECRAPHGRVD